MGLWFTFYLLCVSDSLSLLLYLLIMFLCQGFKNCRRLSCSYTGNGRNGSSGDTNNVKSISKKTTNKGEYTVLLQIFYSQTCVEVDSSSGML